MPSAPEDRDLRATAWATLAGLGPVPPDRPELAEDEDEAGLLASMRYVVGLIDAQVQAGIPAARIVVGGFSQGGAVSLLTGLLSAHAARLAGVMALSAYMPLFPRIAALRGELDPPAGPRAPVFLARGSQDRVLPSSFDPRPKLQELGYGDDLVEHHIYEHVGHTITGAVIADMCQWLEQRLPAMEAEA